MLAACCNVDVIKGGFGFDFTGFWVTSFTSNSEELISSSIFFASSAWSNKSDFFLFRLNSIGVLSSFSALNLNNFQNLTEIVKVTMDDIIFVRKMLDDLKD